MDNFFGDFLKQLQVRAGLGSGAQAANTVISASKALVQKRQDVAQPVNAVPAPLSSPIQSNTLIEKAEEMDKKKLMYIGAGAAILVVLLAMTFRK